MATTIKGKNGKEIILLNPSEKGNKFAIELKHNCKFTNGLEYKADKDGNCIGLTDTERAWRSGYLEARNDSAKCYKALQKKK